MYMQACRLSQPSKRQYYYPVSEVLGCYNCYIDRQLFPAYYIDLYTYWQFWRLIQQRRRQRWAQWLTSLYNVGQFRQSTHKHVALRSLVDFAIVYCKWEHIGLFLVTMWVEHIVLYTPHRTSKCYAFSAVILNSLELPFECDATNCIS